MTDITTIPTTEPELVEVPETTFLALDGHGAPQGAGFERALATLHEAGAHAGAPGPVEGLWWSASTRVGPYDAEGPTIERLLRWIAERGLVKNGAHHEIYLDDPRTTAPDRLRTIIRQPVRGA